MRSYYIRVIDHNEVKRLKKSAKFFERYKHRALLVTDAPVPTIMIVKTFDGDISENRREWYSWVRSSIVEDLHHEFVSKAPIPQAVWSKAVKKWESARKAIQKAQDDLQKALEDEKGAAEGVIRVNGMAPLVIGRSTYDAFSYVSKEGKEVVSFRERNLKSKLDTI